MRKVLRFLITLLLVYTANSLAKTAPALVIHGASGEAEQNLQTLLGDENLANKSPTELQRFIATIPERASTALQPFGYFNARVTTQLRYQHGKPQIVLNVKPGAALPVRSLDVQLTGMAIHDPALQKIMASLPLKVGQAFSAVDYDNAKKMLLDTALERGYFDARFTQAQVIINLQTYSATITLHFATGIRYHFGAISFSPTAFNTDFLARFAPFTFNDYYQADKLQKFQQNLAGGSYFKQVYVDAKTDQAVQQHVPITVQLTPLPRHQYTIGAGYGTDTGVRGLLNYESSRVTANGDRFKTTLEGAEIGYGLQADYIIPGKQPATDQYVFSALAQHRDEILGASNLQKIAASYVTRLDGWQQTLSLALQNESSTLQGQAIPTQLMLLPSASWSKTMKDDPVNPTRGARITLNLIGTPDLFGNTAFLQGKISAKVIYPLGQNRLVAHGALGYTFTQNVNNIPLSLQFLAGGTESIRGYPYNSIGPGANIMLASLEYRQHIKGNWYAAAFLDTGNVSNDLFAHIQRGPGAGLVWQSPLGTLELTLAQGMDSPGKPILLQFSMGPDL